MIGKIIAASARNPMLVLIGTFSRSSPDFTQFCTR